MYTPLAGLLIVSTIGSSCCLRPISWRSRCSIRLPISSANSWRRLAHDLPTRLADRLLGGVVDEDIAQIPRILGDNTFAGILDNGCEESFCAQKNAFVQALRRHVFMNRGPSRRHPSPAPGC
jgi:hypothetical protein